MNENSSGAPRLSWVTVWWMVAAAALQFPIGQYLALRSAIVQPLRHAAVFALVVAVCLGIVFLASRLGADRAVATYAVMVVLTIFWSGSVFVGALGLGVGYLTAASLAIVTVVIVRRLKSLPVIHMLFFAWAIFLTLAPWAAHLDWRAETPFVATPVSQTSVSGSSGTYRPDIYVVVLDGYSGVQAMASYPGWDDAVVGDLQARGFRVEPAWTAYASSAFSVSGLLDGSYPVEPVDGVAAEIPASQSLITTGEVAAIQFLDEAGYELTMLEPAWVGYRCPESIDNCSGPPLLDGLLYYVLDHSFLGPLLDRTVGSAWTHAARKSWESLMGRADEIARNEQPDFVFAHLIVPHEPFLLDPDCNINYRPEFDVVSIQARDDPSATDAYLDQARCVDRMLVALADAIPEDAMVLFTADHGAALSGQSDRIPGEWTDRDIRERMSAFFALRAPSECQPPAPVIVQNALRAVMRCLGADDLPDLEPRLFPNSLGAEDGFRKMVELSRSEVAELLGSAHR
jgi:hypothetical protein